jgi:hypothetical protein
MFTFNAVVSPPRPIGPIQVEFIATRNSSSMAAGDIFFKRAKRRITTVAIMAPRKAKKVTAYTLCTMKVLASAVLRELPCIPPAPMITIEKADSNCPNHETYKGAQKPDKGRKVLGRNKAR